MRALNCVHVPRKDDRDAVLVHEGLHRFAHGQGRLFGLVGQVRVVPGGVGEDEDPRRRLTVHSGQIGTKPLKLSGLFVAFGVHVEHHEVNKAGIERVETRAKVIREVELIQLSINHLADNRLLWGNFRRSEAISIMHESFSRNAVDFDLMISWQYQQWQRMKYGFHVPPPCVPFRAIPIGITHVTNNNDEFRFYSCTNFTSVNVCALTGFK
mmetsp:Transcript_6844/g.12708  ORF Transcript_6844/g.12708 Transcript_6844/m.12708 type:complete len:211 (-) Transcript_6844:753-1385(-)